MACLNERQLRSWQAGISELPAGAESALRLADAAVVALLDREIPLHPDTIYGWFGGENDQLGRRAPALIIRQHADQPAVRTAVLNAAASFLAD
jgi:hypothetical protein